MSPMLIVFTVLHELLVYAPCPLLTQIQKLFNDHIAKY